MVHPVTIVHAADLHLDSPMLGIERYDGAPVEEARAATRRAFESVVELCRERGARLLLLAGDLFDGEWKDYQSGLWFVSRLERLRESGTRVVLVRGNHDAYRNGISARLSLPEHVHRLAERTPETRTFEDLGVAVHGQGHASPEVRDNLVTGFPKPLPGLLNIGLLHTNVGGTTGHGNYAPCRLSDLAERGYDYWALGHIHARAVLAESPWAVYSGCTQGRGVRETGAKGCCLLTVEGDRIAGVEFVETDAMRWEHVTVPLGQREATVDDATERALEALAEAAARAEGRVVAARVSFAGVTALHGALSHAREDVDVELRAHAPESVWVEKVVVATRSGLDRDALLASGGALGALLGEIERIRAERDTGALEAPLAEIRQRAGRELAASGELDLTDGETLLSLLGAAEDLLLDRLAGGEA